MHIMTGVRAICHVHISLQPPLPPWQEQIISPLQRAARLGFRKPFCFDKLRISYALVGTMKTVLQTWALVWQKSVATTCDQSHFVP